MNQRRGGHSRTVDKSAPTLLAALAHYPFILAARLSLHSARRQPRRAATHICQHDHHDDARRTVAWRELDVRDLGRSARHRSCVRTLCPRFASPGPASRAGPGGGMSSGSFSHSTLSPCCGCSFATFDDHRMIKLAIRRIRPEIILPLRAGPGTGRSKHRAALRFHNIAGRVPAAAGEGGSQHRARLVQTRRPRRCVESRVAPGGPFQYENALFGSGLAGC